MQLPQSLDGNLGYLIATVARQYRVMFDREMQPLGLTRSQWWALVHVYYYDGISQAELSELLEIDKAAVARLIARMESKGWIERRRNAQDARALKIFLTPGVHHLMADITALSDQLIAQSMGKLGKARIKEMQSGLASLSANLGGMNGNTAAETIALRKRIQKDLKNLS